ncbi:unnamed protein product [Oikopleura dioica]|uniref:Connexin N-terminal domain-containing protein n=1 Tax=Oikopleura dioica TaxID=34765 RepID=E4X9X4_OIKDI|nr:unnamed protein product [Oikopleura dioica]
MGWHLVERVVDSESNAPDSAFAPISQIRFWGAQIICVATPGAFFVVYSIQSKNKLSKCVSHKHPAKADEEVRSAIPKRRLGSEKIRVHTG